MRAQFIVSVMEIDKLRTEHYKVEYGVYEEINAILYSACRGEFQGGRAKKITPSELKRRRPVQKKKIGPSKRRRR